MASNPVTQSELQTLTANYLANIGNNKTQSVWFSASDIMSLIQQNSANGLRIYFGKYASNDPTYPNQLTVILLATNDVVNPQNPTTENSADIIGSNAPSLGSFANVGIEGDILCPPRCKLV